MKKIFFVALTIVCSCVTTFAQSKTKNAAVLAFNLKFPKATKVNWEKENATEYEANFLLDEKKHSANYSIDGKWLETESIMPFSELPEMVQNSFNLQHKGAKVKLASKIENHKDQNYYEIEAKKGLKTVEYFYTADGKSFKE